MIDVSCKYELIQKWIHFPFFLSYFFPFCGKSKFLLLLTSLRNLDNKQGILKGCYTGRFATTIFSATQVSNAALQPCCDIVSNGCNIVLTLLRCVALKIVVANGVVTLSKFRKLTRFSSRPHIASYWTN